MKERRQKDIDAGSRMHVLDWLESPNFIDQLRSVIQPTGLQVELDAIRQPKGRHCSSETTLIGPDQAFLTLAQQDELKCWWLAHQRGAKLPTWDLVIRASGGSSDHALILFEAKAHATEFCADGKPRYIRSALEEQLRTDANHERIGEAISEACRSLACVLPGVNITRDSHYQFANRIAFAWKLSSLGVPVALVYLGFIGDATIAAPQHCFSGPADWTNSFTERTAQMFPTTAIGSKIICGAAPFWLLLAHLDALRQSPPPSQRRRLL